MRFQCIPCSPPPFLDPDMCVARSSYRHFMSLRCSTQNVECFDTWCQRQSRFGRISRRQHAKSKFCDDIRRVTKKLKRISKRFVFSSVVMLKVTPTLLPDNVPYTDLKVMSMATGVLKPQRGIFFQANFTREFHRHPRVRACPRHETREHGRLHRRGHPIPGKAVRA